MALPWKSGYALVHCTRFCVQPDVVGRPEGQSTGEFYLSVTCERASLTTLVMGSTVGFVPFVEIAVHAQAIEKSDFCVAAQ